MSLIDLVIAENKRQDNASKTYPASRIYVARLVRIINTKPTKLEKRLYVHEKYSSYRVLLQHVTGDTYRDIETDEIFTLGTPSVAFYNREHTSEKLYVSPKYMDKFTHKCYDILKGRDISNNQYLSVASMRQILNQTERENSFYKGL